MKTLERCQWGVVLVPLLLSVNIFYTFEFEQTNVCWVHIEKTNTSEDKIGYIMRYVEVFKCEQNLLTNSI